MRSLIIAAALALGSMSACAQAQEAGASSVRQERYETKVFQLPAGARPHDAAPGRPGEIWYTAQRQGALGVIDIASGEYRQVSLGEGSAPHGVVLGPDGKAWITDGG